MGAEGALTVLLCEVRAGAHDAEKRLVEYVYPELRRLASVYLRRERAGHTLQPTALVHEAFLRLFGSTKIEWQNRAQFFAIAAGQMRRILIDHARQVRADKRGGGRLKVTLSEAGGVAAPHEGDLLAVDEALTALQSINPRAAHLVELRFFGGLNEEEAAHVVGISPATARRDWRFARTWLFAQLSGTPSA